MCPFPQALKIFSLSQVLSSLLLLFICGVFFMILGLAICWILNIWIIVFNQIWTNFDHYFFRNFFCALPLHLWHLQAHIYWAMLKVCLFFLKYFTYLERGEGRDVWEIHGSVASCKPPTVGLAHNPGIFPDLQSNQWPFGSQASTLSTKPHQPGRALLKFVHSIMTLYSFFFSLFFLCFFLDILCCCAF